MALIRYESQVRPPLVEGDKDYHQVTEDICRPVEAKPTRAWWIGFIVSVLVLCIRNSICNNGGDLWNGTMESE